MRDRLVLRPARRPGAGTAWLTLGGLGAAFGAASCCGLPFLLAGAGLGVAWLGGIARLADPLRPWLLGFAALALAGGAAGLARQQVQRVCVPGAVCAGKVARGLTLLALLAGVALLNIGYAYV